VRHPTSEFAMCRCSLNEGGAARTDRAALDLGTSQACAAKIRSLQIRNRQILLRLV
jgi:hypothetical protein